MLDPGAGPRRSGAEVSYRVVVGEGVAVFTAATFADAGALSEEMIKSGRGVYVERVTVERVLTCGPPTLADLEGGSHAR